MCGIVGSIAERNVTPILLEGLQRLEYRGYDSAGLAVIQETGCLERRRVVGKVKALADNLTSKPLQGTIGIAHTRWATHGAPGESNAHPHLSKSRICLVHNGIIENFEVLRDELMAQGYQFESETDSEVIAHLVDFYYEQDGSLLNAVRQAVKRLEGAYALGVMTRDDPSRIVAARAGSPLVIGVGLGENYIASDVLALKPVTDRFIFLEEGDLVELTLNEINIWDVDDDTVIRSSVHIEIGHDEVDKGNYRHHMLKEIHEQPRVVRDTLEGRLGKTQLLEQAFGVNAAEIFDQTKAVTIVACGTSYYSASVTRYWIEELVGIPCQVEIASEFRYRKVAVAPDTLFVTISQSGETADTLAALRIAKDRGYFATMTFCNVATSSMVRESDLALMLKAGPEIGVASTKAFVAMLVDQLMFAVLLGRRHGLDATKETEIVEQLALLPETIERFLKLEDDTLKLAEEFLEKHHALFLGRGPMFPIAMEGALKLKEISYIHAEGYPAGELKHGPLALVDDEMPVVAIAPNDDLFEKVQSNLQEVRARGGQLMVFAAESAGLRPGPGVTVISVPEVHTLIAPIAYTVPLQLLAYHVAVLKGTDVDQPRNLAKSVTVE